MFQQQKQNINYCDWCNLIATKCCGKCNKKYYCSKECQINGWNNGNISSPIPHKLLCNTQIIYVVENRENLGGKWLPYIYIEYASLDFKKAIQYKKDNFIRCRYKLDVLEFFVVKSGEESIKQGEKMYYQLNDCKLQSFLFFSEDQAKQSLKWNRTFPIGVITIEHESVILPNPPSMHNMVEQALKYEKDRIERTRDHLFNECGLNPNEYEYNATTYSLEKIDKSNENKRNNNNNVMSNLRRYGKTASVLNFAKTFLETYPNGKCDIYTMSSDPEFLSECNKINGVKINNNNNDDDDDDDDKKDIDSKMINEEDPLKKEIDNTTKKSIIISSKEWMEGPIWNRFRHSASEDFVLVDEPAHMNDRWEHILFDRKYDNIEESDGSDSDEYSYGYWNEHKI
jgi:hypothetical protein